MKSLKIVIIIYLLMIFEVKAQTPPQLAAPTKIIPPSPTASALGKYGDIPVSNYTGISNISIPLYAVKSGTLEIPISLSYHASGIRVEEGASWCGLGWSAMAGGVITRSIRGIDDLRTDGNGTGYPEYVFPVTADANNNYVPPNSAPWGDIQFFRDTYGNLKDAEPDAFFFNFAGHSGKFYLQQKPTTNAPYSFILESQEKLKIEIVPPTYNKGWSWVITTEDGVRYYFGTEEKTSTYTGSSTVIEASPETILSNLDMYRPTSSWYLDKIVSPAGNVIDFTYTVPSTGTKNMTGTSESRTYILHTEIIAQTPGCFPDNAPPQHVYHYSRNVTYDVYLKQISYENGKIEFITSDRDDIPPLISSDGKPQKLDRIQVSSGNLAEGFNELKSYQFNYSYFVNDDPYVGNYLYNYTRANSTRLKLLGIQEKAGNSVQPPYEFEYITNSYVYGDIPHRYSKSRDHWGFFNNANNTMVTDVFSSAGYVTTMMPPYIDAATNTLYNGADRETNEDYIQLGTLKKIKYPTGGTSEFEYEANDYSNFEPEYKMEPKSASLFAMGSYVDPAEVYDDITAPSVISINVTEPTVLRVSVYGDYPYSYCQDPWPPYGGAGRAVVRSTGSTPTFSRGIIPTVSCDLSSGETQLITLPAGTYEVTAIAEDYVITTAYLSWKQRSDIPLITKKGGGVRIARTTDYNGTDHSKDIIKRYLYTDTVPTPNGLKSSGVLMSPLNYEYTSLIHGSRNCSGLGFGGVVYNTTYLNRSSESNILLGGSAQGNPVGYSIVTVLNGNDGENGKTVYTYKNDPDILNTPFFPSIPNQPNRGNGLLTAQVSYKKTNDLDVPFHKVSEIRKEYTNELSVKKTVKGMKCFGCEAIETAQQVGIPYIPIIKFYDNSSEWWHPKNETSIVYNPDDQSKYSVSKTEYFYENPVHLQLTKTISTQSDGSSIITENTYPADYVSINSGSINSMKGDLYMHNALIEKVVKRKIGNDVKIVAASFTSYKDAQGDDVGTPVFPSQFHALDLNVPKSTFISSLATGTPSDPSYILQQTMKYDPNGNIAEVTQNGLSKSSYIWGYNAAYPVAEVKNAAVKDVFYTGFDFEGHGNSTDSKAGKYSKSDGYQNIITNLTNGSYILEYWRKSGSVWVPVVVNDINVANGEYTIDLTGHIDEVRFYPSDALITTYTYDPLVGMTSSTDPKGQITYYEYDSFQRLKNIKDHNGNIIKSYDYHYKP